MAVFQQNLEVFSLVLKNPFPQTLMKGHGFRAWKANKQRHVTHRWLRMNQSSCYLHPSLLNKPFSATFVASVINIKPAITHLGEIFHFFARATLKKKIEHLKEQKA